MGRKATERQGYSKSKGQAELAAAVAAAWPLSQVKQDVSLHAYVEKSLGYPWQVLTREYGRSMGRLDADVVLLDARPVMFEFHGRQHYEFVSHFHGDKEGWEAAKERDNQKVWLSQRLCVPLVAFRYDETPTRALVMARATAALRSMEPLPGYAPCPSCGRLFTEEYVEDGRCPGCRADERKPGLGPSTDEERERLKERRNTDRERAKAASEAYDASPEGQARAAESRRREKEAREQGKARAEAYAATPEGQARAEESRAREHESRERQKEVQKARLATPEAQERAATAKQVQKERQQEREAARRADPERIAAEASRKQTQKERKKASEKAYQESEAGQAAKQRAADYRKAAYQAAKARSKKR